MSDEPQLEFQFKKKQDCTYVPPQYSDAELAREQWRDVPGFERYEVSDVGRLRSKAIVIERIRYGKIEVVPKGGRFINPTIDNHGYPQVKLYSAPHVHRSFKLHKVVALAFLENHNSLPYLNHKDGDKANPRLSNLEWCTAQENTQHAWRTGLCTSFKGEGHGNAKLKDADIPVIRAMLAAGSRYDEIGQRYGVTATNIYYIAKGTTWKHVA